MGDQISRFLPNNHYRAALAANAPTSGNPFATIADIPAASGDGIYDGSGLLSGNTLVDGTGSGFSIDFVNSGGFSVAGAGPSSSATFNMPGGVEIIDSPTRKAVFGGASTILEIEVDNGSHSPFGVYENHVGGAVAGDNYSLDFYYNDSAGIKTLGGGIATRVDSAPTVGDVNMSMTLNGNLKIQDTGRVLMTTSALTGGAVANLEVRAGAGTGNTTFLAKSNGNTASQIVMWVQNLAGNNLFYIDATAKHFHNVSQLSTGDFNIRGGSETNLFYSDAGVDKVGIAVKPTGSHDGVLVVNGDLEILGSTEGLILEDRLGGGNRCRVYVQEDVPGVFVLYTESV